MAEYINGTKQEIDPRDATCVVGEVKTGSTFFAGAVAEKTGSGTQTLSDASEVVAAGYYAATTLSAVDAHLAAENIKKDVVIFGITGTVEEGGVLLEDTSDEAATTLTADTNGGAGGYNHIDILGETELTLATTTTTFDADSMTAAVGMVLGHASDLNQLMIRLYIDSEIVDSQYLTNATTTMHILKGSYAVDGEKVCKLTIYNEDSSTHTVTAYTKDTGVKLPFALGVVSIKV